MHSSSANVICRPNAGVYPQSFASWPAVPFATPHCTLKAKGQADASCFISYNLKCLFSRNSEFPFSTYYRVFDLLFFPWLGDAFCFNTVVCFDSGFNAFVGTSVFPEEMMICAILLDDEAPFEPFPHLNFLLSTSASCYLFVFINLTVGKQFTRKKRSSITQPHISL